MYNDFFGEVISEEVRTGKRKKPDPNNPVTKQRRKLGELIRKQASEFDTDPAYVALSYVEQNLPEVQRFVATNGEQPRSNPAELALQAYMIRDTQAQQAADALGCSKEEAHVYLDQAEAQADKINSSDADNFIGAIFEALGNVAQKGIEKIKQARDAKGKKPGIWGVLSPGEPTASVQANGGKLAGLKVAAGEVLDAIKETEKRKEIKKMTPTIIIGVVALILVVVLITVYATKRK